MPNIKHILTIKASSEKVFDALTTQKGLSSWWTKEAKAKPEAGNINEFRFGSDFFSKMKVTKLEKNKRIEWDCVDGAGDWIGTSLTFNFEEKNGSTLLRFVHTRWREENDFYAMCNFGWGFYLESLKNYCETGKGKPFENE